eukprot:TRINITY_DN7129_c0_g1_i1.p1 TRINITY_DN7129_c0_g1~~TRINITY_DN7129_c0_g1_i1.p1  ORF type:complete len:580 (+),score=126.19 TRINITY_DN7129_c0_g1_i1:98-1837(+)
MFRNALSSHHGLKMLVASQGTVITTRCLCIASQRLKKLESPLERYYNEVERLNLKLDSDQLVALEPLERLHRELRNYKPQSLEDRDQHVLHRCQQQIKRRQEQAMEEYKRQQAELFGFAGEKKMKEVVVEPQMDQELLARDLDAEAAELPSLRRPPQGVYLWGPVGCGKSLLMDLFYDTVPVDGNRKLRIHFHSFMRDVLASLHRLNQHCSSGQKQQYDNNLVQLVAKSVAQQAYVLCFDEMQIPDVGTAGVLYRLFQHLNDYGVVVVATSNRAPDTLYQGQFKESLFDPFVAMLQDYNDVVEMTSTTDYRKMMETFSTSEDGNQGAFIDPYHFGSDGAESLRDIWDFLTQDDRISPSSVAVFGRSVTIPEASRSGLAYFDFHTLCAQPLGSADYLAIARQFHTVFVENIPKLSMATRNEARRLITLVDALYECKTKLHASFALPMERLFIDVEDHEADAMEIMHREMMTQIFHDLKLDDTKSNINHSVLFTGEEEVFASKRCISRLQEMRSPMYMTGEHQPGLGSVALDASHLDYGLDDNIDIHDKPLYEDRRNKPVFRDRHFFGSGWWEQILAKKSS